MTDGSDSLGRPAQDHTSDRRLRMVLESVPGYVLLIDRQFRVTFVNRLMAGVKEAQVLGANVCTFAEEQDRSELSAKLHSVLDTGEPQVCEVRVAEWLGSGMYRLSLGPLREPDGPSCITLIAEDISRQKEMEAQLLLSERLASIGTLAAGVAHEINNPLTYVLGNLELLERQVAPELSERVQEAIEGSERIARVVRDLMTFSHRDDAESAGVDVAEAIDKAVRLAHHELHRRARLVREGARVPFVRGSAGKVAQVILNLLLNAAHSIEPGHTETNEIRISTHVQSEELVRISVKDTGRGIERALLGKIFDPFVTTRPVGNGTGLGLYVCHNIVSSLGGAIWVDSQVGRGTTFHVDLPIQHQRYDSMVARAISLDSAGKLSLLIVDDEPSIAAFIQHAFSKHDTSIARSGREALNQLASRRFDAVLCDVVMPDMSGVDVFNELKRTQPDLVQRFMFITGGALSDLAPEVRNSRCPVLYKPFNLRELRSAVAQVLDTSHAKAGVR